MLGILFLNYTFKFIFITAPFFIFFYFSFMFEIELFLWFNYVVCTSCYFYVQNWLLTTTSKMTSFEGEVIFTEAFHVAFLWVLFIIVQIA